jgi:uncharacterized protein YycO
MDTSWITVADLQPGDVMLYRPSGVFGWAIRFHTGQPISHVEVYLGNKHSVASRDGKGVAVYDVRMDRLAYVLRPTRAIDVLAGWRWCIRELGQPYGWLDLAQFFGFNVNAKGIVCSPFATKFLRACGLPVFGDVQAEKITPCDFILIPELLAEISPREQREAA